MPKMRIGRPFAALALGMVLGLGSFGCQISLAPTGGNYSPGTGSQNAVVNKTTSPRPSSDITRVSHDPNEPQLMEGEGREGHGLPNEDPARLPLPRELSPTALPPYVIEPPDVLYIDAVRLVPRPPYHVEPLDVLLIQVTDTLPNQPISGPLAVSPEGVVNLGFNYGVVHVVGMTVKQAAVAIRAQLQRQGLQNAQVSVSLVQFRGVQQTRGEHLVIQDGTITLGTYGSVPVVGMTICQAKAAIERHLSNYLLNPEISLSVSAFNSKVYYVIADGGGFGQQIYRFPITGKEYVLDAISNIGGLPAVSSRRKIWVARPAPADKGCYQILPVDWQVITQAGATCTNYQLLPGDRVYIKADPLITP